MDSKLATVNDIAGQHFDFVIIGGGTAGLCLANRLSADPQVSVAVLEAGKARLEDPLILNPTGWLRQAMNPEYDWAFPLVPQKNSDVTYVRWNRGKSLGGSSTMNILLWTRPQREDVDALEKLGNPGWNWEVFYKYFKKLERFTAPQAAPGEGYRGLYDAKSLGHDGLVDISFTKVDSGVELPIQKSLEHLGVPTIQDAWDGDITGTFKSLSDLDPTDGTRSSAAIAYLKPILDRKNIHVLTEAYVTKLVLEEKAGSLTATAVEFEHGGNVHKVFVNKEAIVSAGTIKSPQILELSGIGNAEILQPLGIPVRKNLPAVGTNVQDHMISPGLIVAMRNDAGLLTSETFSDEQALAKWCQENDGADPTGLCLSGCTFLPLQKFSDRADTIIKAMRTKVAQTDSYSAGLKQQYTVLLDHMEHHGLPAMEIFAFPFNIAPPIPFELPENLKGKVHGKPFPLVLPSLVHPFSRGTVHARSADPKDDPLIDPRYFEEEADLDILLEAFKFTRKVSQMEPFKEVSLVEVSPGPQVQSDEDLKAFIRNHIYTTWHSCGSCSMLPEDKGGVVDSKLKVYGTSNLRVVDLSVLPLIVSVHTQAVVYGIAEMAADIIKADHTA